MASRARFVPFADLPPAFRVLWLTVFVNRVGSFVVPFLAIYLTDVRGLSVAQVGLTIALYGAGAVTAGPLGGALADRIGRRRAIALGLSLSALSMVHLTLARDPLHVDVATFLVGLCAELSRPASNAAVSDLVPPAQRARAFAQVYWAANLGFALASFAAGWLARFGFSLLFYADAITSLLAVALVLVRLPETRPSVTSTTGASALVALRDRRFVPLFALSVLTALVFMQFHSTLPLDMRGHGIDTRTFGALAGFNGVLVVLLQPLTVKLAATLRPRTALALGSLLTGAGFGVFGVWPTVPGYLLGILVLTVGEITVAPAAPVLVAEIAPESLRGTYQGTFHMSYSIAACLGPLLGSRVLGAWGSLGCWTMALAVSTIAAGFYWSLRPRGRRSIETATLTPVPAPRPS